MKKFFVAIVLLFSQLSWAYAYSPENKVIKVIIPQPPASGLSPIFFVLSDFAKKNKIDMQPVFMPGANGAIGIKHAANEPNNGNTLLLSTVSDYVNANLINQFDNVSAMLSIELKLVASKKSKITSLGDIVARERSQPGQLSWSHSATAQEVMIDDLISFYQLDRSRVNKVPFGNISMTHLTSVVSGDLDLAFLLSSMVDKLALDGKLTVVDIDHNLKQQIFTRKNAVAVFLPKNSPEQSIYFWNDFIAKFLNDPVSMEKLSSNSKMPVGPAHLSRIVSSWTQQ
jgi:tripartite-type tricarboxylate transporter receptor subunit TctC